ncbi:hypothetical protein FB567DRAFT_549691 [Paraphoma chrysanthemicola]|uniref:Uncharacterized protein n=1 Tax=Paraphoma chrysanthemicola TaxID=798071 RepID=A0A8K0R423_9PLEO|nr:hypothetical protein FB567DRAFT_549691 [Paraphoma chrysanthemicola]
MSHSLQHEPAQGVTPTLRLRPDTGKPNVRLRKQSDGAYRRHPDEIKEDCLSQPSEQIKLDISVADYRVVSKRDSEDTVQRMRESMKDIPRSKRAAEVKCEIIQIIVMPQLVDMRYLQTATDDVIERAVEAHFVYSSIYLIPGLSLAASMCAAFHRDWSWNARGVYYRHYYSPHWITGDHTLWIPTIDHDMFDHPQERPRRERAQRLLRHALDNKRWTKSEYAWEADAWSDVFGQIRDDPALAADKRECYMNMAEVYPVSATLTGKSEMAKRIPDASIGLATFHPQHYQNAIASYELDSERLQALTLHRKTSLISDPRLGESDLVYPFLVYEAKGWSGDPRDARLQACAAGATYLDMLDALARHPGPSGKVEGAYQFAGSRSAQVFALTSFGSHWHIMVGYRRPRLKREHAGHPGMSKTVYLYQRVWSGLISDERKAWELLSLIDQIHEWGVTTFRDYVIRHLRSWHKFGRMVWKGDAERMRAVLGKDAATSGQFIIFSLPSWADGFGTDFKAELRQKSGRLMLKRLIDEQAGEPSITCVQGSCRARGYKCFSPEDFVRHCSSVHDNHSGESGRSVVKEVFDQAASDMKETLQELRANCYEIGPEADTSCAEQAWTMVHDNTCIESPTRYN